MNRIDRLFGILTLLQSRKYVRAETISEKFGISIRTVYRDIRALGEQGIPVSFDQGKGYFVVPGYFLPPVSFSTREANALLLMETMVYGLSDKSIQKYYSSALNKVKAVMKTGQKDQMEVLYRNIRMQLPSCFNHDFDHLAGLQEAVSSKSIIEITYSNSKEQNSVRKVEPIGLVFYALNWHLIAWCHLRAEYRDFRVSRIIDVHDLARPFEKTDHMELNEYMKQIPVSY